MRQHRNGMPIIFLLVLVLGGFGAVLWVNSSPPVRVVAIVPTMAQPTSDSNAWQQLLRTGLGNNATPLATIAIPTQPFVPATLSVAQSTPVQVEAAQVSNNTVNLAVASGATPTSPAPTSTALPEDAPPVTIISVTQPPEKWNPPALIPPINRDPLGRDHYWLMRPVDANANNAVLFNYPFGSDGPDKTNPLRVHHGIDMPNPVGETVRAAGSGVVIWAADGRQEQTGIFQNSPSYGNVIFIEHDFSYGGQIVYTLYAHLSAALVTPGQYVQAGEVIGLVGNTGRVSGPHVHFEVRLGSQPEAARYDATYNPVLWMVPYIAHGVIAGRIVDGQGKFLGDMDITVRSRVTGLVQDTTTSYVMNETGFDVRSDPKWGENFAVSDVPVGRYDVIATIDGQRIVKQIEVFEGVTAFVELSPPLPTMTEPATVTPQSNGG